MKPLIVANWKANKTNKETVDWAKKVGEEIGQTSVAIVICPPFTCLETLAQLADEYPFKVGAQNVSRLEAGAFTGEVSASMLKEVVTHCLVGHSERRRYFEETDQTVMEKVDRLLAVDITPILCISDQKQLDSFLLAKGSIAKAPEKIVFVYEPPGAISGGGAYRPEEPEEAEIQCKSLVEKIGKSVVVLYGGSVNPKNIATFIEQPTIQGVLVGQASLSVESFVSLLGAAR